MNNYNCENCSIKCGGLWDSDTREYCFFDNIKNEQFLGYEIKEDDNISGGPGSEFKLYFNKFIIKIFHERDCCESTWFVDMDMPLRDHIGDRILKFEKRVVSGIETNVGTATATFFHLTFQGGVVVLAFRGESNGYYSEDMYVKIIER